MRLFCVVVLIACSDSKPPLLVDHFPDAYEPCPRRKTSACNPLTQAGCAAGEKCTWVVLATTPQYVGQVGCAPIGSAGVGEPCMFAPPGCDGYDNCARGLVCGDYRGGVGICKKICDYQSGGTYGCDTGHACVTYSGLFGTGDTTLPAAGVCDVACDPLADNDFDGSGSASMATANTCGSDATIGCYGYPSFGTPPRTEWSCRKERNAETAQPVGLRHRVQCTEANACADPGPTIYVDSCNQGYLPMLRESTTVSTAICVALCKPKNCYAGNCGVADENRLGEAPHRCTNPDRVGSFDTSPNGEHCRFIWTFEVDEHGFLLHSPSSDTLGFCFDHSKYLYDSNADGVADTAYPPCAQLQDGRGSGSNPADPLTYFGAADLGCVDSSHVSVPFPQPISRFAGDLRPLARRVLK